MSLRNSRLLLCKLCTFMKFASRNVISYVVVRYIFLLKFLIKVAYAKTCFVYIRYFENNVLIIRANWEAIKHLG